MNGNLSDLNFNAADVEPSSSFDPIPAGEYRAILERSEIKETKAGNGSYINCQFLIYEGEFENRKIFQMITLKNSNPQAEEIGKKDLSALCRAVGVLTPRDTAELEEKPLTIKVKIQPAKDGYDAKNVIVAYKPLNETSAPVAPAPAPAVAKKPWSK